MLEEIYQRVWSVPHLHAEEEEIEVVVGSWMVELDKARVVSLYAYPKGRILYSYQQIGSVEEEGRYSLLVTVLAYG